ncbi:MAG: AAA family ATPase [Niastella sp.]|nr:AAA family ATPase [Niastella sp.]
MINKVERLVSIGKFRNYQATGQVNFQKLTLIYGDNGGGKTTLTSVLRSLTTNNPAIVRSRISTNHIAPQAAQLTQIGTPNIFHTFGAAGWTTPFADIEIFDIHFVNDNIYSGFDFNDEHKKQLHQFVIGAQGIAIQNQIEQNKASKVISKQNQANIEQQLFQQVGNNLTTDLITSFLAIPPAHATGIDQQITIAEAALASANANSIIQTLQTLSSLTRITSGIDFTSLVTDLQTTSQSIQNTALETLFSKHCQDLADNSLAGPENWLQRGFAYVESKQTANEPTIFCPFCKQSIDSNVDILDAYISKFNANFNALVQRLQTHFTSLQNFNLDAAIQTINNINQTNTGRIASWATHLPNAVQPPTFNIIPDEAVLRAEFQSLISLVQQKIQNPTVEVATATATVFQASGQAINTNIDSYNQSVTAYNTAIATFRSGIQTVANAFLEVERLKRIKKRFAVPIITLCTQLAAERQTLRGLETAYTQLSLQQQTAATTFFNSYQTRINHYLGAVFKTLFRIDDVVHVAPQGRATQSKIAYKLTIDGKDISFAPNQPFSAKECLSEGDKSTIALAFFLSKLDIDTNRQNKILIFDDPLSSLDTNRRTYTIGIIKALFQQMKQVVVLSHNEYFLHEIGKDFGAAIKKTLRITENFAAKASVIEECDLDNLVKIDYFKHIEALEAFRTNPDHSIKDTVLGWLRNVLESHLRFKFYKEIRLMTVQKTFGNLISFLNTSGVAFRDNGNRATIIANLNLINGVSWKQHHGDPNPDYTTLGMNPNTITAPELDNLIQDTLNLIEVQL